MRGDCTKGKETLGIGADDWIRNRIGIFALRWNRCHTGFFPIVWRHAFGSSICPNRDFAVACTELRISKHESFVSHDWPPGGQTLSGCWLASIQDLDPRGPIVSAGDVDLVGSDVSQGMLSSHAVPLRTAGAAVLSEVDASEVGKNGPGMADVLHSRLGAFSAGHGKFLVRGLGPACTGSSSSGRQGARTPPVRRCPACRRPLFSGPQILWDCREEMYPVLDVEPLCLPGLISGLV